MNKDSLTMFKSNVLLVCLVFLLASCGGDRGVGKLFQGTPRKGPNIYSPQGPKGKSRTQRYGQSVKKKKSKRKNNLY